MHFEWNELNIQHRTVVTHCILSHFRCASFRFISFIFNWLPLLHSGDTTKAFDRCPRLHNTRNSINICSIPFLSFLFLYHSVSWYTDICAALEQASKTKTQKTYYTHSHVCIETVTRALGVRKWIEVCILLNGIGIECEPKHINTQTKTK